MDRQQDSLDKKSGDGTRITEVNSNVSSEAGDENRTLWQNVKKYRKVSWITLALTSAILLYGYDNVVVGTVSGMPRFQYVFCCGASRLPYLSLFPHIRLVIAINTQTNTCAQRRLWPKTRR